MKPILVFAALVAVTALSAQTTALARQPQAAPSLPTLPGWVNFKADPYIAAAARLQRAGKVRAIPSLERLAADPRREGSAILLCRMLFVAKQEGEFRRPGSGGPVFLDRSRDTTWPLEPIEVVDGVPFFVVTGYELGGAPERASAYLDYCLKDCDWNPQAYRPKTAAEKKSALEKLIASPRWKEPLSNRAKRTLAAQIE